MVINKKKILLTCGIAAIVVIGVYSAYLNSDEHFLPFLRYKSITEWKEPRDPSITIADWDDHTYWIYVDYCQERKKSWVKWNGQERCVISYADGFFRISKNNFHLKDSTLAKMGDAENSSNSSFVQIIPIKTGKTLLYLSIEEIRDSVEIEVTIRKNSLVITEVDDKKN